MTSEPAELSAADQAIDDLEAERAIKVSRISGRVAGIIAARFAPDEARVIEAITLRVDKAREKYGALDVDADLRDWDQELDEELLDAVVYAAIARLVRRPRGAAPPKGPTSLVLDEVFAERCKQETRWGQQDHPSVAWSDDASMRHRVYALPSEHEAKAACDESARTGCLTWGHILVEELCETVDAADDVARRAELVQLAAVAVANIEAIDRAAAARTNKAA